jgi:two-component system cell cycle sensor histidine kinase/response regulator CckA
MFDQTGGEKAHRRFNRIATQTSTKIGTDFFHLLTKHLAEELGADSVYVGEFMRGSAAQVRTLALCVDGDVKPNREFPLSGSPEAEVARGDPSIHLSDLQSKFPSDLLLRELKAQACVELPLIDSKQRRPGLIGVFYRRPLTEVEFVQSLLEMCVPRVLAELNRKQSEDTLRESEQRYRAFVALNRDPMWCIEFSEPIAIDQSEDDQVESIIQKGRLVECNDAVALLLDKEKPEQLLGGAAFDILPPRLHKTYRKSTESMVRSGYRFDTIEIESLDKAGNPRWFLRTHWGIVENGKLRRIWGLHREITDVRKAQAKLAISEKRLSELVETLHLAAIELDRDGALSYCNDYLLKLTGWKREEIIGKNWFDKMVPPEEREKQCALFSSRTKVPIHSDGTLVCQDRHRLLVGWDYVVIRDPNGRIVSTVGACRDLIDYAVLETLPRHSLGLAGQFPNQ